MTHKDIRKLLDDLERQGFTVQRAGSGHFKVGKDGRVVTTVSCTPGDVGREVRRTLARIRRFEERGQQ
jgi:hypothetical protein